MGPGVLGEPMQTKEDCWFYLVEKKEGTVGSVLGGGSFLRQRRVPDTRKEAHV